MKKLLARVVRAHSAAPQRATVEDTPDAPPPAAPIIGGVRFRDELPRSQQEKYEDAADAIVVTLKQAPGKWVALYDLPATRTLMLKRRGVTVENIDGREYARWPEERGA